MPPIRKPMPMGSSILSAMLAIRLQQLEVDHGGMLTFFAKIGLARGTYYTLVRGLGNPTFKTVERVASKLNMTVYELLGFEVDDARRAFKKGGVDYDDLTSAIRKKDDATRRLARQTRSPKLQG